MASKGRWSPLGALVGLALAVVGTGVGTAILIRSDNEVFVIPAGSMRPTFDIGDRAVVDHGHEIHDGDIVVFRGVTWSGGIAHGDYVKRVIGTGGETVACCTDGSVTRNGVPIVEPYLAAGGPDPFASFPSTRIPAGRLWVLGDNRANSADSRFHINDEFHGTVAEADVIGVVVAHGSSATAYGYVASRAARLALPGSLVAALGMTLVMRFRRPRALEPDALWTPGGTPPGP